MEVSWRIPFFEKGNGTAVNIFVDKIIYFKYS